MSNTINMPALDLRSPIEMPPMDLRQPLIDGFELDVAISEEHSFESDVTQYPVEKGADITDHVRARPITVRVEGLVSNAPIGDLANRRGEGSLPSSDAFAKMLAIRDSRLPVTIVTSLRTYDNMALQSLTVPVDARTGDALKFTALFIQLQLVTNQRTAVRVKAPRAKAKRNLGTKPAMICTPAPGGSVPPPSPGDAAQLQSRGADPWSLDQSTLDALDEG